MFLFFRLRLYMRDYIFFDHFHKYVNAEHIRNGNRIIESVIE